MSKRGLLRPRPSPRLVAARAAVAGAGLLLFAVQPLAGQRVLPVFGGGPGTWAATLAFFQLALLAGYGYAHLVLGRLGGRRSGIVHAVFAAVALGATSLSFVDPAALRPPGLEPTIGVLIVHAASIGPAVVFLAATTPLLTGWLAAARLPRPPAADGRATDERERPPEPPPLHRLYAASNAGALAALLLYPTVLEPSLGLTATHRLWLAGLAGMAVLVAALGLAQALRGGASGDAPAPGAPTSDDPATAGPPGRPAGIGRWVLLAAIPAGLLNASTTLLTLDLGAVPLLWVLPLGVYLATFVLAFSALGDRLRERAARFAPIAATFLWLPLASGAPWSVLPLLAVVLGGLFVVGLALHGALAAARPPDRELSRYYLALAGGGALGGSFAGILAPLVFPDLWELPILLVAAILVGAWPTHQPLGGRRRRASLGAEGTLPPIDDRQPPRPGWFDAAVWRLNRYVLVGVVVLFLLVADQAPGADAAIAWFVAGAVVLAVGGRPILLAGGTAVALAAALLATPQPNLFAARSFFGVLEVRPSPDRSVIQLWNGTTLHGTQPTDPVRRLEPTGYYVAAGPAGDLFRVLRGRSTAALDVGVVGLGVGGLAAYAEGGDRWTFVEVDPLVVRIATDPALFTYLASARAPISVDLDDGRLALARTAAGAFDCLVLDAFTSDAIPSHLLTAEAIADALRTVRPDGLLALQLSNRYYDLAPPVAGAAELAGARVLVRDFRPTAAEVATGAFPSRWLVATRSEAVVDALVAAGWGPVEAAPPLTDDRPNPLPYLRWSFG
ncbi:MAG TPA: fused MFS/spermidine synthase [Candidatus Binatia bacterium]|nr:fused MFS/spermidine synthase [Candidatus Binatia bacterium]